MNKKFFFIFAFLLVGLVIATTSTVFYNSPTPLNYYSFDGSDDYANISSSNSLNISNGTTGITLSAWVRWDDYVCYRRIFAKSHTSNDNPYTMYGLLADCNTSGAENEGVKSVRMELAGDSRQHVVRSSTSIKEGVWYQVTGTYNNSDGGRIYINGILDNSTLYNVTPSPFSLEVVSNITGENIDYNDNPLSIGASNFGGTGGSDFFSGDVDEIKIFNRSLSSSEVLSLYNNGFRNESDITVATSNLVAYYPLNSSNPIDHSGNSNDGTNLGATLVQEENIFNSTKNMTFTGNENRTYWLKVNKDANFTQASFNLTGYETYDSVSDISINYGFGSDYGSGIQNNESWHDGNVSTQTVLLYQEAQFGQPAMNSTINASLTTLGLDSTYKLRANYSIYRQGSTSGYYHNVNISLYNHSSSSWISVINTTRSTAGTTSVDENISLSGGFTNAGKVNLRIFMESTIPTGQSQWVQYNLSEFYLIKDSVKPGFSPTNPEVFASNTSIWDYTGSYITEETTSDFYTTLDTAINSGSCDCQGCILESTSCSIPVKFHSDTSGILEFSSIDIDWLEYEEPLITITQPTGEKATTQIPYDVNVTDNWLAQTCKYWVTRGASLEIDNTTVTCSDSITGNLYVTSVGTNYTFHFFTEDTSGNQNTSSSNFSVSSGGDIVLPPSGGGSPTVIQGDKGWEMGVGRGVASYNLDMSKGQRRELGLIFENLGDSAKTITLSCEDKVGTICQYVTFNENPFELALLKDQQQATKFIIDLPDTMENGDYQFNIKGLDELNRDGTVTVSLGIGTLGSFSSFISKIFNSSTSFGFPYWLIFVGSLILTFAISSRFIVKKGTPLRAIWLILMSVGIPSLIILFL